MHTGEAQVGGFGTQWEQDQQEGEVGVEFGEDTEFVGVQPLCIEGEEQIVQEGRENVPYAIDYGMDAELA